MNRNLGRVMLVALACLVLLPALAAAQSQISGTVKDESGGVLPGVTIEAASPALIEKTKAAVSDANGRFTIVDLRQGTYKVTFTLTGFTTVVRDGVELVGEGRVQLWVLDRARQELRMIATGDEAVIEREGRKGQASADLPTLALADEGERVVGAVVERVGGGKCAARGERRALRDGNGDAQAVLHRRANHRQDAEQPQQRLRRDAVGERAAVDLRGGRVDHADLDG